MASAVVSKVLPLPDVLLKEFLASPSAFGKPAASARPRSDDGTEVSSGDDTADDRRRARDLPIPKVSFADVVDLFDEATKLGPLLAMVEDGGAASRIGFSPRGWWISKVDDDAVQLKVAMPGLGKEHVEMRAEKDVLVIKGEGDKDSERDDDKGPARYNYRIDLSSHSFKMDQIKAEMKNGVLKVTVPKIKDEERKDVFHVKIE